MLRATIDKFLLLLLANFADDNDEARPSNQRLAQMSATSRATVHRCLKSLETQGYIARQESRRRRAAATGS